MEKYKFRKKIVIALYFIIIAYLGFKIYQFIQIDKCLDSGGKWNYDKCECENH